MFTSSRPTFLIMDVIEPLPFRCRYYSSLALSLPHTCPEVTEFAALIVEVQTRSEAGSLSYLLFDSSHPCAKS